MEKTEKFKMINDEVLDSVSGGVEIRQVTRVTTPTCKCGNTEDLINLGTEGMITKFYCDKCKSEFGILNYHE